MFVFSKINNIFDNGYGMYIFLASISLGEYVEELQSNTIGY